MTILEERMDNVEERVDRLEILFGQFMSQTGIALRRIDRSIERIEATVAEMKAEGARDREAAAKDREAAAQNRAESIQFRREMNKRWGDLANKMGTLVEDIVAPSLRRMAREELDCGEERFFSERISRTRSDDPSRRREFDALYVGTRAVLLNETKSSPRSEDVRTFVEFLASGEFALYFPEFQDLPIVPVFSSLHISPDLVATLTRYGIYAVAMGEEAMQILNQESVAPDAAASEE